MDRRSPTTAPGRAGGRFWRASAVTGVPVLIDGERRIHDSELDRLVDGRADELGSRRLVLLAGANDADFVITYLAALRSGSPVILAGADPAPVSRLVEVHDPDVVVRTGPAAGDGRRAVVEHRRPVTAHTLHPDLALLLSTSGSTGSPRLVRLSHDNLAANAWSIAAYLGLTPDDRAITSLPLHYCYGLSVLNSHLAAGASVTLTDLSVVDPCFWDLAATTGVTNLAGVPLTFDLLERVGTDRLALGSLRFMTQAGGRMEPDRVRRVALAGRRHGVDLVVMYGQTEATARMAYLPPGLAADRPDSVGIPIPGGDIEIRPVEGDERTAWPEDAGEIVYRGPNVMMGYADGPTDLSRGPELRELRTGDIGRRADDGLLEVVGRRSRFVKLCGLRIDLDRLEDLLGDDGTEALCVGDDDGILVGTTGDPARVRADVAGHLGLPARLVEAEPLDELPRSPNGKPDRSGLAALLTAGRAGADPRPGRTPVVPGGAGVAGIYRRVLGTDAVDEDDTFVSAGGDSLSYVETAMVLEDRLGSLPDAWHLRSVRELDELAGAATTGPAVRGRRGRHLETGVLLRATAIVFVVGNHMDLYRIPGGAHVLLAVAGFNLARFGLDGWATAPRWRDRLRPVARIAVPTSAWVLLTLLVAGGTGLGAVLLVNNYAGSPDLGDDRWRHWFIEVLVQILVVTVLVLAIPPVRRAVLRWPFVVPMMALVPALAVRFGMIPLDDTPRYAFRTHHVAWIFLLGWAAARARTRPQKLLVSGLAIAACAAFFGDPLRDAVLAVGILALTWVDTVRVPRWTAPVVGAVASASLYVYLTHYEVFPVLERLLPGPLALLATVAVGVLVGRAAAGTEVLLRRRRSRHAGQCGRARVDSSRSESRPTARAPTS